jgi:hypothetical protein
MRGERKLSTVLISAALIGLSVAGRVKADVVTLDFEGFPDSTILVNQYPGVTFADAIILTAGISLNEFEFPPHSGTNVASDNNGPITIDFSTPIISFSGYFTYSEPLTLAGFDASNMEVASAASAYSSNDALFGDSGSSPNEFLQLTDVGGMSSVTITGDPLGESFVMDDVSYTTGTSAVPESNLVPFLLVSIVLISFFRHRFIVS